jgi:hypothetical protein
LDLSFSVFFSLSLSLRVLALRYTATCWPGAEYLHLACADALPVVAEAAARAGRAACLAPLGLRCLAPFCAVVEFGDQEVLVREGDAAQTVFVVVAGECRLTLRPPQLKPDKKNKPKKKGNSLALFDADSRTEQVMQPQEQWWRGE